MATRVVLCQNHLYVERRDGSRERVSRDRLRGRRVDSGVGVYGVVEGEDLFLLERRGCPVEAALAEQIGTTRPVRVRRGFVASAAFALVASCTAVGLLWRFPYDRAFEEIARGQWNSETALGFYGSVGAILFALAAILWFPSTLRLDQTGAERRRGFFPWLVFRRPPEDFEAVLIVSHIGYRPRSSMLTTRAFTVELVLRRSGRFGTLLPVSDLQLHFASNQKPGARNVSAAFAAPIARALSVPVRELERRTAQSRGA